ncbi:thiamine pyrophosphate-dependent dehydrogenase E1 component subunit alpha [Rhodospirillaceae bacterium]|nr:thiamine pyrophosphate-dependent dehydrogenase E1 component subunit alpha [Rhodospirillaceae bacterium]
MKLEYEKSIELYACMQRIRLVEEAISTRYVEQEMRCPVHLSIGQEAAAAGVCLALETRDKVFSTHRSHAHYLSKGGDLRKMLAEIYGKATGCIGGRGGSMHIMDLDVNMVASIPIVGSCIPLAVGSALADSLDGRDDVSIAYLGDASVEEGVFHESANFAKLRNLPVLFVCENNLYSVYTQLHERQPDRPITSLAEAHGIPTYHCDGNDVEEVYRSTLNALKNARSNKGPSFLLLDTYRWLEHCGPNFDNDIGYRTEAEFRIWKNRDPVILYKKNLLKKGILTEESNVELKCEIQKEITAAFDFAKNSPYPDHSTAINHVYA